jgi:dipeptidyl aminopeptidase/acylaminoacyl peptidase
MVDKKTLTVEDLVRINSVEDPRISPDGRWVAFVRVQIDREKNTYLRNIWLASTDGERLFPLTRSGKDTQPRWSPDSRFVAFTSGRNDKPQIYLAAIDQTGDPRKLTSLPNGANAPAWSPSGAQIAFVAGMSAADRTHEADPANAKKPIEDDDKKKVDPRVIRSMPYRSGTSYATDKFAQLYVMPVSPEENDAPSPRRLTDDDVTYAEPVWSPDGEYLYTARADAAGMDEPGRYTRSFKIRVSDGTHEQVTDETHTAERPLPSASGRYLAFLRNPNKNMALVYTRLALLDTSDGSIRDINLVPDLAPLTYAWGGETLYFSAQSHGTSWVYNVDPYTADVAPVVRGDLRVGGFDSSSDGTIAYCAFNGGALSELYIQRLGAPPVALTQFNQGFRETVDYGVFERVTWEPEPGVTLEGWVLTPPGFDPSAKYPLILDIHGGPHIMWSPHYDGEWFNWQALSSAGYIVFFANPRGSVGYGDAFQQAIGGRWGELAYSDIMSGFEQVLQRDYIDPERIGIMGGSYGGYMTVWTIERDHRFKAAIAERGVYNLISFTGTTDIPSFIPNEFGVELTQDPEFLWKQSPIAHAHKIKTPLLIIHSENDFRVAISEAEQLFALVRRNRQPVEFVRYPREGHELSRAGEPEHRIDRLNRIVAWFDKYVKST